MRTRRLFSIAVLAGFTAVPALRAASGAVHEQAGVTLIEVPVTVLDRDGKPVRGLTAADFDVRDEGKEVVIQGVDVTEFSAAKPGAPAPEAAREKSVEAAARRRFLLLFDMSFSSPSRISRIREAARKFVRDQIGPDDLAAVATYSLEHGLNLVVTFTPDRRQLAVAVETLGLGNAYEKSGDPLQLVAEAPAQWAQDGMSPPPTGKMADIDAENKRDLAFMARKGDEAYRRGRVTQLIQNFGSLAKALDSVEGRKQVIYFSQGFDIRLLQGNSQDSAATTEQNENAAHGAIWSIDSQTRFGNSGLQSALNGMIDLFKRSDCVVHAVDLSGLTAGNEQGSTDPSGGSGQAALFAIAEGTGGELFKNANDFSGELDKLLDEQSVIYVLAFSPKLTGHPDQFHNLKVKVKRSGVRISSRAGYYEPKPFATATSVEKNLAAADVIAAEIPVHDVPLDVRAQAFAAKDSPIAMVQIQVPAAHLLSSARNGKVPLEIYAYAFDVSGRVADFSTEKAVLDVSQVKARLDAGGLRYFAQLKLRPGAYRLRALVREGDGGAMGFSASDVAVPDFSKKSPYLVEPLAMGSGQGLVLRGKSARGGDAEEFPYMAGADPFLPDTQPAVAAGKPLKLCVFAYSMGDPAQLRIGGQILDGGGKPVGPANLSLLGHSNPDDLGKTTYLLAWNAEGVSPGRYQLRIMVQDPASGSARQATTPVEVR